MPCSRPIFAAQTLIRGFWGLTLRAFISLAVIAAGLAGTVAEAAAQYYPAPPPDYPPPPPGYVYPAYPPPPYAGRAVYRDGNGAPYPARYDQAPAPAGSPYDSEPADSRSAFPPQPLPMMGGQAAARPPGSVAGGAPDVTGSIPGATVPQQGSPAVVASLPPEDQPEQGPAKELSPRLRRQVVNFNTPEPPGTIIVDTPNTYLYLVLGNGKAMRYGIGVGREGFTWSGTERISRMSEWPDWFPPKEMIERQPYLPRFMAGGESNPLGARALYLGNTLYRIHGTNQPSTIGTFVSSGCIRLTNDDIEDLYSRVHLGTNVVVLPGSAADATSQASVMR